MAALTVAACKSKEAFKPEINIEVMSINRENNTFSVVTLVDVDFDGKLIFTLENKDKTYKKIVDGAIKAGHKYIFEVEGLDFLDTGTYTATITADTNITVVRLEPWINLGNRNSAVNISVPETRLLSSVFQGPLDR